MHTARSGCLFEEDYVGVSRTLLRATRRDFFLPAWLRWHLTRLDL